MHSKHLTFVMEQLLGSPTQEWKRALICRYSCIEKSKVFECALLQTELGVIIIGACQMGIYLAMSQIHLRMEFN
ncbi:hypothetical protein XELAEV_18005980mg [Xenopus laevis]|uniref:Uncharacterized protein n=1 Tax=Xenopus laevis TaxID=8355 RepID=A0A974I355_XENLA|nr:hypothetical protein XELAEV_18005980mg [Xenopus laevis]